MGGAVEMPGAADIASTVDGARAEVPVQGAAKRVDIISDTHGHLSERLLAELEGADLIIHAGDITSESDLAQLETIAPVKAVLGNNDYFFSYGPDVREQARFDYAGLSFGVSHYREELPLGSVDVGICGHTHRARVDRVGSCLVINPGSASFPRGTRIPTMARMIACDGQVLSLDIIQLA